jgi:Na+:H+ antiporter, NhaA family
MRDERRPMRPLPMLVRPLQEFLRTETAGGALLLAATAAALLWANAPFGGTYIDFWGAHITVGLRSAALDLPLVSWVNDGLMAIFFFVVGLEIKRELLRGELASRRKAALPAFAALGGMAVPALIFVAFNLGRDGQRGWGIPMATDIAFAVGVISLAGPRAPLPLKVFLLALAIVDDLGAIAVIAIFYTEGVALGWLAGAAALFGLTHLLGRAGVRHAAIYLAIGVAAWLAVHESGVHATIAGVMMGLLMPSGSSATESTSVLYRLEHLLHPWTSYVVIPIFALANAGIALDGGAVRGAASSPVSLGVALGLMLGKPIGITLFAFLAVKLGVASLPDGVRWSELASVGMVAGIGFTVSLFVTGLAYTDASRVEEAKLGILAGSTLMGVAGFLALHLVSAQTAGPARADSRKPTAPPG